MTKEQNVVERVKIAASVNIKNIHRVGVCETDSRDRLTERYEYRGLDHAIVIGTTLGGPNTVINIMSRLSSELPAAVIVIEEISTKILPEFVKQFNNYTPWRVEVGNHNTILQAGVCYVCSYKNPLVVQFNEDAEPCLVEGTSNDLPINSLFSSASDVFEEHTVGVLLTGIGDDGADGFSSIKKKSGVTIAQTTNTCVYPNLTGNAIEHGVVDYVSDVSEIINNIEHAIKSSTKVDD